MHKGILILVLAFTGSQSALAKTIHSEPAQLTPETHSTETSSMTRVQARVFEQFNSGAPKTSDLDLPEDIQNYLFFRGEEQEFASAMDEITNSSPSSLLKAKDESVCTLILHGTNSNYVFLGSSLGKKSRYLKSSGNQIAEFVDLQNQTTDESGNLVNTTKGLYGLYVDLEDLGFNMTCDGKVNPESDYFNWNDYADASPDARYRCALEFADFIERKRLADKNHGPNIIAHSHGGNCAQLATQNIYEIVPQFNWEKNELIYPNFVLQTLDNGSGYISESTLVNFFADFLYVLEHLNIESGAETFDLTERSAFQVISTRHDPNLKNILRKHLNTQKIAWANSEKWITPNRARRASIMAFSKIAEHRNKLDLNLNWAESTIPGYFGSKKVYGGNLELFENRLAKKIGLIVEPKAAEFVDSVLAEYCTPNSNYTFQDLDSNVSFLKNTCAQFNQSTHHSIYDKWLKKLKNYTADIMAGLSLVRSGIKVNNLLTLNTPPVVGSIPDAKFGQNRNWETYIKEKRSDNPYLYLSHIALGNPYEPNWDNIQGMLVYLQPQDYSDAVVSNSLYLESSSLFRMLGLSGRSKPEQSITRNTIPWATPVSTSIKRWFRQTHGRIKNRNAYNAENRIVKSEINYYAIELPLFLIPGYVLANG